MANVLYTPTQAARSTLAALRYLTTLPRTVRQDFSAEFVAGRGRTVDVKKPPTVGESRTYTDANRTARDAIVFDDIDQDTVPVTMDTQVYKAVRLPDDFNTFTLTNLEDQVLRPQAESVVDGITAPLVTQFNAVAVDTSIPTLVGGASANIRDVLIAARAVLNARKVPMSDRFVALSPEAEAAALQDELLQKANESGTDGMLREAIIGRLFGFTILSDPNLTGAGEKQTLTEGGSGLTSFTITYAGQTTSSLDDDATAAEVQAALVALSNVADGDVVVTGGPLATGPFTLTWKPSLGNVAAVSTTPTGGTGTVVVATSGTSNSGFGVAYHRDAFAHVTRPSRPPEGAAMSAVVAQDGFALRWLQHYNPLQLEDQSVVDAFVGATTLDSQRAVAFRMAE